MEFRDLKRQYEYVKKDMDLRMREVIGRADFIQGEQVAELERRLAAYVGTKHCVACANGTDALQLALMAWGVGEGDAVFGEEGRLLWGHFGHQLLPRQAPWVLWGRRRGLHGQWGMGGADPLLLRPWPGGVQVRQREDRDEFQAGHVAGRGAAGEAARLLRKGIGMGAGRRREIHGAAWGRGHAPIREGGVPLKLGAVHHTAVLQRGKGRAAGAFERAGDTERGVLPKAHAPAGGVFGEWIR